jgi:hypothetical protein
MRTLIVIAGGFALLGLCLYAGRLLGRGGAESMLAGAKVFIPLWLALAAANMWIGVARAGYSVMEELPIFLAIFGLPAAVAGFVWWKFS